MTLGKDIVPDSRRRFHLAVFACAFLGPLSLLLLTPPSAESYSDSFSRGYSLAGTLELGYERSRSQGRLTDDFRQFLSLEHRGFVTDPQLLSYEISGRVSHDAGQGTENSSLMGADIGLTLFRTLPRVVQNASDYIPHPLWLRYSRESDNLSDYTSYGLSISHSIAKSHHFIELEGTPKPEDDVSKPEVAASEPKGKDSDLYEDDGPSQTMKIVEKENIPFPISFFDYDHMDLKSQDSRTVNDIFSLRSSLTGESYDYRFLYENQNQVGSQELQRSVVQLEPIYRFFNAETKRRIDIRNLLRYEAYNQAQSLDLGSNFSLSKPMGKDEFSVSGAAGYTSTSAARQTGANYNAAASANYKKFLSPRLTNDTSLSAGFTRRDSVEMSAVLTKSNTVESRSMRLSDTVSADISRLYRGGASAYVGDSAQGVNYGANVIISTKTRITTSLSYSYSLSAPRLLASTDLAQQSPLYTPTTASGGRASNHDVAFIASGPLLSNLAFQARAGFILSEAPVSGGTSTEETGTLSGNLLWQLSKTQVALGGNYSQAKKKDTEIYASSATSLFATLTRVLPMRMLFNFYSNWTKSASTGVTNGESTRLELRPKLSWTRGLTTVDTEYSYSRSSGGGESSVDQRFYVRLVRRFSAML